MEPLDYWRQMFEYTTPMLTGVARGALGARAAPPRGRRKMGCNLQGKVVRAPPGRARVKF